MKIRRQNSAVCWTWTRIRSSAFLCHMTLVIQGPHSDLPPACPVVKKTIDSPGVPMFGPVL